MATSAELNPTFVLTRKSSSINRMASLKPKVVSTEADVRESLASNRKDGLWISLSETFTELLQRLVFLQSRASRRGDLVLLHEPRLESLPALNSYFERVLFSTENGFLPMKELAEVLIADNRQDLFIGGSIDREAGTLTLFRGDRSSLTVPLTAFQPSGQGNQPNFDAFAIADCGQTIKFGDYEAATDAVLYEFDPDYRRRMAKARQANEKSFGASLRRLRKQRKLGRDDFSPIAEKTVARIERGEVAKVHRKTLGILARKLGVSPEEIETY